MTIRTGRFKGLYSALSVDWATDQAVYESLDNEFHFDDDPCPLGALQDGLSRAWGRSAFVNPPYGRGVGAWLAKAVEETRTGKSAVFLLPARTDTAWWHDYVLPYASEIRFVRGRLKFGGATQGAPFPSVIIVFRGRR